MPNRILKESICTSEDIAKLSPQAEILFYRLMVKADDFGLYFGNEKIIKNSCYPLKSDDIKLNQLKSWLNELQEQGLIFFYITEDNRIYLKITKWEDHQQKRATKSKYPLPTEDDINRYQMISDDCNCPRIRIRNREYDNGDQSGREIVKIDDVFEKTYEIYPKHEGVKEGKKLYIAYLTKGIKTTGFGTVIYNHQQIYIAIKAYAEQCNGKEPQFIKQFDGFMDEKLMDYISQTIDDYEYHMKSKYGDNWEAVKFEYI